MLLLNAQHPNRKPPIQMQMFLLHFSNSWRTVDAIAKQTQREVMHSKQQAVEFAEEETDLNWGDEQADEHDEPAAVGKPPLGMRARQKTFKVRPRRARLAKDDDVEDLSAETDVQVSSFVT